MKTLIIILLLLSSWAQAATPPKPTKATAPSSRFDLLSVSVANVVQLVYSEAFKTPYVLAPEVLNDQRLVSFRYAGSQQDIRAFMRTFLDSLGYTIQTQNSVDYVRQRQPATEKQPEKEPFIYRPKYRDVSYLSRLLSPLFQGSFSLNRAVAMPISSATAQTETPPEGSAAAMVDQSNVDALIFTGTQDEIQKLQKLLPQVDFAQGEVLVRGVVTEVSTSEKDGSAFGLLAKVLGGDLNLGIGNAVATGNFLQLKSANLDLIYSLLRNDSRFNVVSSPSLRIRSGTSGSFSVGQDVPVLGAVSYPSQGQAVQSVEYRNSGVLFSIRPDVKDQIIDLAIDQQLSNFITTTTGVNNTPTLIKRALRTTISAQDGDLIVLGGLTENKDSTSQDGFAFLPKFMRTKGTDSSKSEILLILQVTRI